MNSQNVTEIRSIGSIVLQRLGEVALSKALELRVGAFAGANALLEKASQEVDAARRARTAAQRKLGQAAAALNASVEALATQVVGAGIGERMHPFAAFSTETPSSLSRLQFAHRSSAARSIVADLRTTGKLHAEVARAASAVEIASDALDAALADITPPELAYQRARGEREPIALGWAVALRRLKNAARVVWEDKPSTYDAVFAPPDAVRVTRARRRKAKAVTPAAPTVPEPAPAVQAVKSVQPVA